MHFKCADLTLHSNQQLPVLKHELLSQELQDDLHYLQAETKQKVKQCIPKEKDISTEKNPLLNRFPHIMSQTPAVWN